jgi:hypothetical protein
VTSMDTGHQRGWLGLEKEGRKEGDGCLPSRS